MDKKTRRIYYLVVLFSLIFVFSAKTNAATLTLSPSSWIVPIGQTFTVDINLNTQGTPIDGVDVYSLRYNPAILEVQDSNTSASGIQISPGTLLANTLTNTVNSTNGTIQFSQVTSGGTTYNSSGTLATITFKGKAAGNTPVAFDFVLGSTSDTNVAGAGQDKLSGVTNGSYTVTGGGGGGGGGTYSYSQSSYYGYSQSSYSTPTPTRTPTPTPTSTYSYSQSSYTPGTCPCSLWNDSVTPEIITDPGTDALEIGVKFKSDVSGYITGLRFYKSLSNTGVHNGHLWSITGELLGSVTFTNESDSGWQQANFLNPISIAANSIYIASYHTNTGYFSVDRNYFVPVYNKPPLHALSTSESINGVFLYGPSGYPTQTYFASNYWVDVVFNTTLSAYHYSQSSYSTPTPTPTPSISSEPTPTASATPTPILGPTPVIITGLPKGFFDGISGATIFGWTYDPDNTSTSNNIQIFIDNDLIYSGPTNVLRPDVNEAFNITGYHGFAYEIPTKYRDNKIHRVYIYGMDINEATQWTYLTNSPRSFVLAQSTALTTPTPIIGVIPTPIIIPTPIVTPTPTPTLVVCSAVYNPVCGVDGKTYANLCVATEQNKVDVLYYGACVSPTVTSTPTPSTGSGQTGSGSSSYAPSHLRGRVIRSIDSPKVYYVTQKGLKRWIPNESIFLAYGNRWTDIIIVSKQQIDVISDSILIRATGDSKVYKLDHANRSKHWIISAEVFNRENHRWDEIAPVNQMELDWYLTGESVY